MSDVYVRDLRKTRAVNQAYWHDLHLFAGTTDPDTAATAAHLSFTLKIKNTNIAILNTVRLQKSKHVWLFLTFEWNY